VGLPVNIVVVDREGRVLGTHSMEGARTFTRLEGGGKGGEGLEGLCVLPNPDAPFDKDQCPPPPTIPGAGALLAAISKAGTAAFFSTQGNAFSTRTAGFIVQQHFPPGVINTSGGPLFGVQFSQLPCSDVIPSGATLPSPLPPLSEGILPLGLSADPGGLPLYADGEAAGGVGVEGDGKYTADADPGAGTMTREERIAAAATRGFVAPAPIRGDQILLNGLRFPFQNVDVPQRRAADVTFGAGDVVPMDTRPSRFVEKTLGGVQGTIDPRYEPKDSIMPPPTARGLTALEVTKILGRAARQADRTRAAIRRPLGDRARVNITVVDRAGNVLGIFRTKDAPTFGFDVSAQKARTALFFSLPDAGETLRRQPPGMFNDELPTFVEAARRDGVRLDGSIAFSNRAQGFLSRPFFPDGIDGTRNGPFSVSIRDFSVFNTGLQVAIAGDMLFKILTLENLTPPACSTIPGLGNGIQIFSGSVPLYRGRELIGAVGVSGDGIEQDDLVAFAGSRGLRAPSGIRADRVHVRGVRLPFVKFPRRPITK
jgi:uncharacterized protein GlcG (DUF336 family)